LRNNRIIVFCALWAFLMLPASMAQAADRALGFALSGVVEKVLVKQGQKVSAGQALARLDTTPIKARLSAVKAELVAAAGVTELAQRRFDYAQEQFDAVSLSKVELDTARIARDEALARQAKATARQTVLQWRLARSTLKAVEAGRVKSVRAWPGLVVNLRSGNDPVFVISVP
jgi:multidrug efflux pump subunit AcrA (membrane-fusion protein)